jgi:hypothetical protein
MRGLKREEIALIIIYQNAREDLHLTLIQNHSGKFVDLRTCSRDRLRGNYSPPAEGITVKLELWPQFMAAVSSPGTWTEPLPYWGWQKNRDSGKGRLIFPQEVLQKTPHEQILLENKNFQGIPFIFLKTFVRSTRNPELSLVTIGPLLWSQLMQGLQKMEQKLFDFGWLARENDDNNSGFILPFAQKNMLPRPLSSRFSE